MKQVLLTTTLIAGLFTSVGQAATLSGLDLNNHSCQISFDSLNVGPTIMHDACDFDSDGKGPWCDQAPKVPVNLVTGSGTFVTAAGTVGFTINDQYGTMTGNNRSFVADGLNNGGYINVSIDPTTMKVHADFLTPYGQTLTSNQIISALRHVPADSNYQAEYNKIYTEVNCSIQR